MDKLYWSKLGCDYLFYECEEMLGNDDFAMGFSVGCAYKEMTEKESKIIAIVTSDREKEIIFGLGRRLGYTVTEDTKLDANCTRVILLPLKSKKHLYIVK